MGRWGLVAAIVGTPIVLRALALVELAEGVTMLDLRGFAADIAVSAFLLAGLLMLARRKPRSGRIVAGFVGAGWVLAHVGLYEFIYAHGFLHAFDQLHFLRDPTFILGSVVNVRHPIVMLLGLALAVWGAFRGVGSAREPSITLVASLVCAAVVLAIPLRSERAEWRQRNCVAANLLGALGQHSNQEDEVSSEAVDRAYALDLSGERWVGPLNDRPNILWVMLEGVSGAYLPSVAKSHGMARQEIAMPALDSFAKKSVLFPRVISNQRQTNRGEYAILCGDYPKLRSAESKMTEVVLSGSRRCLPAVLREHGYRTVYIQAAPLGFMLKDQFMTRAGFDWQVGDEAFADAYARTAWGVDDKAFFEQALPHILTLHRNQQPYFAVLLTVGTHHPYTFPRNYAVEGARGRSARAFRWADEALDALLQGLEESGVFEDTVVLVTSDESAGFRSPDAGTYVLSQHWSFAAVRLPGVAPRRIDEVYEHVDLAASFADLVGADPTGFVGRSLFRTYAQPSEAFFGNVYAMKSMMWLPEDKLVVCDERAVQCAAVSFADRRWAMPGSPAKLGPDDRNAVLSAVQRAERGTPDIDVEDTMRLTDRNAFDLRKTDERALIFGGQYLDIPARSRVRVALELAVQGGTADVHHDAFAKGYGVIERSDVTIPSGKAFRFVWEANYPNGTHSLVVQLYARAKTDDPARLVVREATLAILASNGFREDVQAITETLTDTP